MSSSSFRSSSSRSSFVHSFKYVIILFWIILSIGLGILAPRFVRSTTNDFAAPAHSEAAQATAIFDKYFGFSNDSSSSSSQFIIFSRMHDTNASIVGEPLRRFELAVNATARQQNVTVLSLESFFLSLHRMPDSFARSFLAEDERNCSAIMTLEVKTTAFSGAGGLYAERMQRAVAELLATDETNRPAPFSAKLLGIDAFLPMVQGTCEHDLAMMDAIVLPLAMIVLALTVRSLRLLILPLLTLVVSAACSFGAMFFATFVFQVSSVTSEFMMSVLLAFSIDYSLFLLTRLREELARLPAAEENQQHHQQHHQQQYELAVSTTMSTAGHTIIVSGLTLTVCFISLMFISVDVVRSLGTGCAVAVLITLATNLSLTPAILLCAPKFFINAVKPSTNCCDRSTLDKENQRLIQSSGGGSSPPSSASPSPPSPSSSSDLLPSDSGHEYTLVSGCWGFLGRLTARRWAAALLFFCVLLCAAPFAPLAFGWQMTDSVVVAMPRGNPLTTAFAQMTADFGYGRMNPFRVPVLTANSPITANSEVWTKLQRVAEMFGQDERGLSVHNVTSLAYAGGRRVPLDAYTEALPKLCAGAGGSPLISRQQCNYLNFSWHEFTSTVDARATWLLVAPQFDPTGPRGLALYEHMQRTAQRAANETGFSVYVSGGPATGWAAVQAAYDALPTMIGALCAVVFVFVGVAFRSVFVPLRCVLTGSVTLLFTYGVAVLVYEKDLLNALHFEGLRGGGALLWMPPLISLPILVGIGLDYDVFLLTRIREYRAKGYGARRAVVLGLWRTGYIINYAGLIMALAFSGLLFSSISAMNQLSLFMVVAVLFDTFVVRSLLVPASMGLLGELAWWPLSLPTTSHEEPNCCDPFFGTNNVK